MLVNSNIYQLNWDTLIQWLMPTFLRKLKHWEWLRANLFPLIWLNTKFEEFRAKTTYSMSLSPQVVQLERLLNDRYDEVQRRIFIRNGQFRDSDYLFKYLEQPKYVESHPTTDYIQSYNLFNSPITVHFYIIIPIGLLYNEPLMRSLVNRYKALGYTFLIIEE